jgi:hypothetical protein
LDDPEFQQSLKQVLGNDGNNEESLKGMEAMLKSLEKVMLGGADGDNDFGTEAFAEVLKEAGI